MQLRPAEQKVAACAARGAWTVLLLRPVEASSCAPTGGRVGRGELIGGRKGSQVVDRASSRTMTQMGASAPRSERRWAGTHSGGKALHRKILRVRIQHDQGAGGLLRMQLELVRQADADALGAEQLQDRHLVFQTRAGGIAEGIA